MEKPMVASLYGDDPSVAQPMAVAFVLGPVAVVVAGGVGLVAVGALVVAEAETYVHFHHYEYTYSKTSNE